MGTDTDDSGIRIRRVLFRDRANWSQKFGKNIFGCRDCLTRLGKESRFSVQVGDLLATIGNGSALLPFCLLEPFIRSTPRRAVIG